MARALPGAITVGMEATLYWECLATQLRGDAGREELTWILKHLMRLALDSGLAIILSLYRPSRHQTPLSMACGNEGMRPPIGRRFH